MLRIRWSDPEPEDQAAPLPWPYAALITGTLFLNFPFWYGHGDDLWLPGTLPQFAAVLATVTLAITALFFAAPALASHAARRPLFDIVESSLGSIPAWLVRLCSIWFLVVWTGWLVALPASWFLPFILRRDVSTAESGVVSAALVVFLFVTGLQSLRTSAKMALFSDKLGFAILVAALVRVHEGLPAALTSVPNFTVYSGTAIAWHGLSLLAFNVGPLILLASDFGYRMKGRKQVALTAGVGIVLPFCVTMLLVSVIGLATGASRYYQPSLQPTVAMALWSRAAGSALPGRMMIAAMTIFGAVRFGARSLRTSVSMPVIGRRLSMVPLGCFAAVVVGCSLYRFDAKLETTFETSATCLAVAAAVLTGDFVSGARRAVTVRRIDWVGFGALVAGLATAYRVRFWAAYATDAWWEPELLPSYGAAFMACFIGRVLQRKFARQFPSVPAVVL